MSLAITPLYAALFTFFYIGLSIVVIRSRYRTHASLGDGGDEQLKRAVRAHANFAEYVPLALVLFLMLELQDLPAMWLHALALALLAGRTSHAYSVISHETRGGFKFRMAGMATTFTVLVISALLLLLG